MDIETMEKCTYCDAILDNVIYQDLTEDEKIKHLEKLLDLEKEGKIRLSTEIDYLNRQLDIKWYI